MNHGWSSIKDHYPALFAALCCLVVLLGGLGMVAFHSYLEVKSMGMAMPLEQMFSYRMISYANLLLIGSTVLYVAHPWFTARGVGMWATGLSVAGACAMVAGLTARASESYFLPHGTHVALTSLSDVVSLFSAITVVIYIIMERAYRSRSAGAFVMPIVAAAVLFNGWLAAGSQIAAGHGLPILRGYSIRAHVLTSLLAYSTFAVGAAMGVMYLLRRRHARDDALADDIEQTQFDLESIERLMHQAVLLGLLLFSCSVALGTLAASEAWGGRWAWDAKENASLLIVAIYGIYAYLHHDLEWGGLRLAWWAIVGFGLTVFCFLGISLIFPGLHSYG